MVSSTLAGAAGVAAEQARFRVSFHFVMALVMAGVVVYGFSHTIGDRLIHPDIPRPRVLYVHAAVFSAWLALYIVQTGLVASRNVRLHRRLGLAWFCVGALLPLLGVVTSIVMRRFDIVHLHRTLPFLSVPLMDMVVFTTCFGLAALWRRSPEYHRRLMFLATCGLLDAGLGRFPTPDAWFLAGWFYGAIDVLVLVAMARDFVVQRRVHPVFAVGLPLLMLAQVTAWVLWRQPPALWITICRAMVGVG